ncbi:MAG: hypothetical protein HY804_01025 [Nitrospinae bacterium]|nr:hypothetical protein [Nitrospinota bacterium]
MEVQPDFKELLALFNARKIEYVIVGAFALAFHGAPRFTGDLDILIKPDPQNAQRVIEALDEFGFKSIGLAVDDFTRPESVVQLGVPPVRVDLLTSLTGVVWDEVWKGKKESLYGGIPVPYLGRQQIIANKRALGRKKDLADLETLGVE